MQIALWFAAGYLVLGILMTVVLSQTPYSDNAWWLTTLLWPLFLFALIFG